MFTNSNKRHDILKVANLVSFIGVLVLNFLANYLPINGVSTAELSDMYPNLVVPMGFTFSIWGVIYVYLAVFIAYQFTSSKTVGFTMSTALDRVGIFFVISSIGNMAWIVLWHYQNLIGSLLAIIVMLLSLLVIYVRVNGRGYTLDRSEKLMVRNPFSIYLAWISLATILNLTALLVDNGWDAVSTSGQFWALGVYAILIVISAIVLSTKKDIVFNLVYIWALIGVAYRQIEVFNMEYRLVYWGSIVTMIAIVLLVIKFVFWDKKKDKMFQF